MYLALRVFGLRLSMLFSVDNLEYVSRSMLVDGDVCIRPHVEDCLLIDEWLLVVSTEDLWPWSTDLSNLLVSTKSR